MKKNKRILSVLLVLVLCLTVCGCTAENENLPTNSDNTSTETSALTKSEETSSDIVSSEAVSSKENESQKEVSSKETSSKAVSSKTVSKATSSKEQKENKYPYFLSVNRKQNVVTVYKQDKNGKYTVPVKAMVCSCGKNGATPKGDFKTQNKYEWRALVGGVYGQYATRITGQILFHSVPYFKRDKSTLEYEEYNKLGTAASLGCVRLSVIDAKWIYDNCALGTSVKIYDSDEKLPLSKPTAAKIDVNSKNRGWDPTDPDKNNPWKKAPEVSSKPQPSSETETSSKTDTSGETQSTVSEETVTS